MRSRFPVDGDDCDAEDLESRPVTEDAARTVDHLSGGSVVLGIGAGWYGRDDDEYGCTLKDASGRLVGLEDGLRTIHARLARSTHPRWGTTRSPAVEATR